MNEESERKTRAKADARRIVVAARAKTNVQIEVLAAVLEVSVSLVKAILFPDRERERHLKYADLYLLATHPATLGMARELLVPLNAVVDHQRLTLQDLDGLSKSPMTIDLARVLLRPTLERLFPAEMRSTLEVKP